MSDVYQVVFSLRNTVGTPKHGREMIVEELSYPQRRLSFTIADFDMLNSDRTHMLPRAVVRLALLGRLLVGLPHPGAWHNLLIEPNEDAELLVEIAGKRRRVKRLTLDWSQSVIAFQLAGN